MDLESLLDRFDGVRRNGSNWVALCPSHDDRNPSLSITEGERGPVVHCHAGCADTDVLRAVGLRWQDIREPLESPPEASQTPREVATYDYTDPDGNLLYQVVRYEPKKFKQRQPDGEGGWIWGLDGVEKTLYRLPELIAGIKAGRTAWIVDGEKDAEAIHAKGGIATCCSGGGGNWEDRFAEYFHGANVVKVVDKDKPDKQGRLPGFEHSKKVRDSVAPVAASFKAVEAKVGKDSFDHFAAGLGPLDFVRVDLDAVPSRFRLLDLDEVVPPAEWLMEDFVCMGDVTLLYGPPGAGKTFFAYGLELAITQGHPFFLGKNMLKHGPVIHFDEEMPRDLVSHRLKALGLTEGAWRDRFFYYWRQGIRLDEHPEHVLEEVIRIKPVLITIDSFTRVHRAEENAVESIGKVLTEGILPLARETGAAVLLMHHSSKAGTPRGSSDIEAAVDAVVRITPDEEQKGRFTISQGKTRRSRGGGKITVDIIDQADGSVSLYPQPIDWRAA